MGTKVQRRLDMKQLIKNIKKILLRYTSWWIKEVIFIESALSKMNNYINVTMVKLKSSLVDVSLVSQIMQFPYYSNHSLKIQIYWLKMLLNK